VQDTAQDLVSEHQGDPDFVVPLDGRVGYLRARRKGKSYLVELDDQMVGDLLRATVRDPWHPFALEREGHSFLVVSCCPDKGRVGVLPDSTIEVFADGINLHDGRTVDEWRRDTPGPRDPVAIFFSNGIPRSTGLRIMFFGWAGLIALSGVPILLSGQPRPLLVLVGLAAWLGLNALTQRWVLRHQGLGDALRMGIVMSASVVPFLAMLVVLSVAGAIGPAR